MKLKSLLLPVTLSVMLAACGNLSNVNKDGTADKLVWPKVESSTFNSNGSQKGIWPNWDNVHQISKGMNKDQIMALIGRPHFNEGMFDVREWDYVFNLRQNGKHKVCQFKVLFDKNMDAQSFYWLPENCGSHEEYQLSSDFLFDLNSADLKAESREVIGDLVKKLAKDKQITVTGYTDRLGSDSYNLALSKKRAETVKKYMVELGVEANRINAIGLGKADPIMACDAVSGKALVSCLAPNRRVVIATD
ncbi:OmpA family protein [Gallibacterium melopsittaci]|uniref:OmpA family protein n=1 Tax=Gallibacterium melopsittaci TaxID=516063 RepID=A0ABV6HSV4_9PAST